MKHLFKAAILFAALLCLPMSLFAQSPEELYNKVQSQKKQFVVQEAAAQRELEVRTAAEASLVVLQDNGKILPLSAEKYGKIAVISDNDTFAKRFNDYFKAEVMNSATLENADTLKGYDLVVAAIESEVKANTVAEKLAQVAKSADVVFAVWGGEALASMPKLSKEVSVIYTSGRESLYKDLMAQAICGAFDVNGRLAENTGKFKNGAGVDVKGGIRFKFTIGEEVGINSAVLEHNIDSIIINSIHNGAFPGCQLLIAKDQKVIFYRSYGHHTFSDRIPVRETDMYDLASNTKVSAATPLYMQLFDQKRIDLDIPISNYLPGLDFEHSNKSDVTLRRLLAHIAGFQPFYPFYEDAQKAGLLSNVESPEFPVRIDHNLWASDKVYELVYKKIRDLPLTEPNKMKYSCLGFVLSAKIIENASGRNFHKLLQENIYDKLGAPYTMFNPYTNGYPLSQIIPTEYDLDFRKVLVHGFVHDETSALVGGYSSNAGLFSNALGVAKLFQMYLNKGTYGGVTFFSPETFDTFNTQYYLEYGNFRGLGLEKPTAANAKCTVEEGWPAPSTTQKAFGHSGFTGTYIWAEPENGTLYVFLSNRVYPTRKNKAFDKLQARVGIHELIYQLLKK